METKNKDLENVLKIIEKKSGGKFSVIEQISENVFKLNNGKLVLLSVAKTDKDDKSRDCWTPSINKEEFFNIFENYGLKNLLVVIPLEGKEDMFIIPGNDFLLKFVPNLS